MRQGGKSISPEQQVRSAPVPTHGTRTGHRATYQSAIQEWGMRKKPNGWTGVRLVRWAQIRDLPSVSYDTQRGIHLHDATIDVTSSSFPFVGLGTELVIPSLLSRILSRVPINQEAACRIWLHEFGTLLGFRRRKQKEGMPGVGGTMTRDIRPFTHRVDADRTGFYQYDSAQISVFTVIMGGSSSSVTLMVTSMLSEAPSGSVAVTITV